MLTFAPIINILALLSLRKKDPAYYELEQYLSTEIIEFLGMFLVCCSYWNKELSATYFELCGYTTLSCAALWDVTYPINSQSKIFRFSIHIVIRSGSVHWNEAFGLFLLGIVAIGKYLIYDEIHGTNHKKYDSNLQGTTLSIEEGNLTTTGGGGGGSGHHLGIGLVGIPIGSTGFGGVSNVNITNSTGMSSGIKGD